MVAFCKKMRGMRFRDDSGAALVEFALVAPLLLLMVFGIFEFGRVWNVYQTMTDAAREGARRIAVANGQGWTVIEPAVRDALALGVMDPAVATITPGPQSFAANNAGDGTPGSQARVDITYDYTFNILGNIPTLFGSENFGTITLSTFSVMRNE